MAEAYKAYKKDAPEDAVRCMQAAIDHYTLKGNFRRAATAMQSVAETYEIDLDDPKRAIKAYSTAAGWFETDGAEAYVVVTKCGWSMLITAQTGQQVATQGSRPGCLGQRLCDRHTKLRPSRKVCPQ